MIFEGEISWVTSSLLSQEHNAKHNTTATFIERETQTKPGMEATIKLNHYQIRSGVYKSFRSDKR
jgi:hypothetical protein